MNKAEFVEAVAERTGLSKKDSEKALAAVFSTIRESLQAGEKVQVFGFGSFEVKERAARTGRNPKTGETMEFAASKTPVFKASKSLKDELSK